MLSLIASMPSRHRLAVCRRALLKAELGSGILSVIAESTRRYAAVPGPPAANPGLLDFFEERAHGPELLVTLVNQLLSGQ